MGIGNLLIGDVEELLTRRVLRSGALHRMIGERSQCWQAEIEIERMYPGTRCLLLPSATVGFALVLEVLDFEPGSEVLISPFGWLSNWSCITRAGLVPRFLPLDDNLQLRTEDVAARLTERTKAIVVAHLMGRGQQKVDEIAQLCAERKIVLLEDIAQSFGVSVKGRRAGTYGVAAWCSFNHHKLLSTGDGGCIISTDPTLFARITARHDHGLVIRGGKRRVGESIEPGLSLRSSEIIGALLRAQLARFNFMRTRILRLYEAMSEACARLQTRMIEPHEGDLPFTVLFERPSRINYPSLMESGWHVASKVPWLETKLSEAAASDPELARTEAVLGAISAVGSGFVDPYYAIQTGITVRDAPEEAHRIVMELESMR